MDNQDQMGNTLQETAAELNGTTSLGQWARSFPASISIFHQFGLDYCCGGKRSLDIACAAAGLEPQEVLEALERRLQEGDSGDEVDPDTMGMSELVDHIVERHHGYLREQLPELIRLTSKIARVHGGSYAPLLELDQCMKDLSEELTLHMHKEEVVLFPYIKAMDSHVQLGGEHAQAPAPGFGTVQNPVRMMMIEHDQAGDVLKEMRRLTDNYILPEGACMTWWQTYNQLKELEKDLMLHIHLENNILFPAAIKAETAHTSPI